MGLTHLCSLKISSKAMENDYVPIAHAFCKIFQYQPLGTQSVEQDTEAMSAGSTAHPMHVSIARSHCTGETNAFEARPVPG